MLRQRGCHWFIWRWQAGNIHLRSENCVCRKQAKHIYRQYNDRCPPQVHQNAIILICATPVCVYMLRDEVMPDCRRRRTAKSVIITYTDHVLQNGRRSDR